MTDEPFVLDPTVKGRELAGLPRRGAAFAIDALLLFVFGTPAWLALAGGLTNGQGEFSLSVTIPNVPGLQYSPLWFTGLFGGSLPVRSTAPLGGVVR